MQIISTFRVFAGSPNSHQNSALNPTFTSSNLSKFYLPAFSVLITPCYPKKLSKKPLCNHEKKLPKLHIFPHFVDKNYETIGCNQFFYIVSRVIIGRCPGAGWHAQVLLGMVSLVFF
ncbi:MAG: hypothetical protein JXD22_11105 [Sedimentisphaerales bacterium]|nr:hypothetical protein [Sedimentisphaerales bacterium]